MKVEPTSLVERIRGKGGLLGYGDSTQNSNSRYVALVKCPSFFFFLSFLCELLVIRLSFAGLGGALVKRVVNVRLRQVDIFVQRRTLSPFRVGAL